MNKTGTTSLLYEFVRNGISTGNQREAEQLLPKYINGNIKPILNYCRRGVFFQDIPFSIPNFYKILDKEFPNSKFILTIRNSAEDWYDSLIRFHTKTKLIGTTDKLPTSNELKLSDYVYKGWAYDVHNIIYDVPYNDPYNKDILISTYENHKKDVIDYFKDRNTDLLIIDLCNKNAYKEFKNFFKIKNNFSNFLHKNSSK